MYYNVRVTYAILNLYQYEFKEKICVCMCVYACAHGLWNSPICVGATMQVRRR